MADPKIGYLSGIKRTIQVSVDSNGDITSTGSPKVGYDTGVLRVIDGHLNINNEWAV